MQTATDDHDFIPSLNGLRALSVLIVLAAHSGYGEVVPGGLGVTIFFFLSGYLITTLLLRERTRTDEIGIINFYIRRLFRLTPPLLIALSIAYALTLSGVLSGGVTIKGLLALVFYFANYYAIFFDPGYTTPNGTAILWSLAVEEHFYIFYPTVMALMLKMPLRPGTIAVAFVLACVAILAWRIHLVHQPGFEVIRTYFATDTRMDSILYGCITALAFNPVRWNERASNAFADAPMSANEWCLLSAAIALLAVTILVRDPIFRETYRYSLQGLALMPIFYYAISQSDRWPFSFLNVEWVSKLGVYSYSIYLIHSTVIKSLTENAHSLNANRPILFFLALAISGLFAFAIDRLVDPYFRTLRKSFRGARCSSETDNNAAVPKSAPKSRS